jgi:multidrug efflux pump subunit AcrA (membrane-fusion protein)
MKKIKNVFKFILSAKFLVPVLVLILAASAYYIGQRRKNKNLDELMTAKITKGDITVVIQKEGYLQPQKSSEISSRVSGRIGKILVKEGDTVKKGAKLAVILPGQSDYDKFVPVDIYSPIEGMVLRCLNERSDSSSKTSFTLPEEGKFISGSQDSPKPTCLMKIIVPGKYSIPVKIEEKDIALIKKNMPVNISVSSIKDSSYRGTISFISPQPEIKEENYWDPESSRIEFVVVADTLDRIKDLLIGLSAMVKIELSSKKDVLVIPNIAIYEEMDQLNNKLSFYVYKNTEGRKAKKIKVDLGLRNDSTSELLNGPDVGLKENDVLIVDIHGEGVEIL